MDGLCMDANCGLRAMPFVTSSHPAAPVSWLLGHCWEAKSFFQFTERSFATNKQLSSHVLLLLNKAEKQLNPRFSLSYVCVFGGFVKETERKQITESICSHHQHRRVCCVSSRPLSPVNRSTWLSESAPRYDSCYSIGEQQSPHTYLPLQTDRQTQCTVSTCERSIGNDHWKWTEATTQRSPEFSLTEYNSAALYTVHCS